MRWSRRVATVLFFVAGASFLIEIAWLILARHDERALRLVALVAGIAAVVLWQHVPRAGSSKKDAMLPVAPLPMPSAPVDIVDR